LETRIAADQDTSASYAIAVTAALEREADSHWWSRPCGVRDVLQLAVPLIISTGTWTIMNFVDRLFLLWHSESEMAAAMPAGMLHFALVCFPMGVAAYVNTFVAQYYGAKRLERIAPAVWQGIRIGLYCFPFYLALIPLTPYIFRFAGHAPDLARCETVYLQIAAFGAGAEIIAAAQAAFFTGRGTTSVVMVVDASASILNIVLDYGWIFGHFGLPEWGIAGAAWATVISLWWRVIAYTILMSLPRYRSFEFWKHRRFDRRLFRRLLKYGGPTGLHMVVEIAGFTLFLLLVGNLGKDEMAATTLAFTINNLAFVPLLGLGLALSTMVGRQLGHNHPELAVHATWTSLWMAVAYMGVMSLIYVLCPDIILLGHAAGASPEEFARLRDTTVVLLRFVAAYCLFDALNIVFASTLKGAGDTRFILITSLVLTPVPLVTAWLGIRFGGLGLLWCWITITGWVCALGIIYSARFFDGRWKQMRVIEAEFIPG